MISLHGAPDECGPHGAAGAVAAALRAYRDAEPGPIRAAADEWNYFEAPVACHVATLDGGARLVRGAGEVFARTCWARCGPTEGACTPADGAATALTDALVVVLVGSAARAHRVVVVRRDGAWRALELSTRCSTRAGSPRCRRLCRRAGRSARS